MGLSEPVLAAVEEAVPLVESLVAKLLHKGNSMLFPVDFFRSRSQTVSLPKEGRLMTRAQ